MPSTCLLARFLSADGTKGESSGVLVPRRLGGRGQGSSLFAANDDTMVPTQQMATLILPCTSVLPVVALAIGLAVYLAVALARAKMSKRVTLVSNAVACCTLR